ncbi:MAG: molecular chaperone DnaJ [Rhodospirillum sp.]|nr:molecular chaperone DnaJ [Rhodospirillum sp.]
MVMAYLLLGLLALFGTVLLLRIYASASPASLTRAVRRTAIVSAILGAVLLLLRLPLGYMLVGIGAILPLTLRWRALWPDFGVPLNQPRGKSSRIETKYLRMALDHDSGALDGLVLAGRHRDQLLSKLTLEQLLEVRADCIADDPQGVPLIEAYLDRIHGATWREIESGQQSSDDASPKRASAVMTREEAFAVLGLPPTASDAEIRETHRRLMMKLHPDHGGSDYLAAKINQARDVLLGP